jgi:hypothetical protein
MPDPLPNPIPNLTPALVSPEFIAKLDGMLDEARAMLAAIPPHLASNPRTQLFQQTVDRMVAAVAAIKRLPETIGTVGLTDQLAAVDRLAGYMHELGDLHAKIQAMEF